ncbi:hypothetical protein ATANTOWER_001089 [Ataeniobius toweri]|uniref:Uncharacterized protein n=1 Tax=Ataeniobius toweri TaxID=208326 RepID=A0ABU7BFG3_9TELE|nr:hypothetical protein [Ataeniobius toweri]
MCCVDTPLPLSSGIPAADVQETVQCWEYDWWDASRSCFPMSKAAIQQLFSRPSWRLRDSTTCLRPFPLCPVDAKIVTSSSPRLDLLNVRSVANKSFLLNALFIRQDLDFLFFYGDLAERRGVHSSK